MVRKIFHWKHGWIPISPEAKAFTEGKGPRPLTGKPDGLTESINKATKQQRRIDSLNRTAGKRAEMERRYWANRPNEPGMSGRLALTSGKAKPLSDTFQPPKPKPTVKNYKSMSNADKIHAAATMYGTGSKQHRDAERRFGQAAPNANLGVPDKAQGDFDGAQRRASEISALVPGLPGGGPRPHYQFASQDMRSRYTGGVVFDPAQADALLDFLERNREGMATPDEARRTAGLPLNTGKGTPEQVAKRRARRLAALLGGEAHAAPHYDLPSGTTAGEGKGYFTGGIYLRVDQTDDLIKALRKRHTGTATSYDVKRAAGLG